MKWFCKESKLNIKIEHIPILIFCQIPKNQKVPRLSDNLNWNLTETGVKSMNKRMKRLHSVTKPTMFSTVCPANSRSRTATWYKKLIRIADMVHGLGSSDNKLLKIEANLANIRVHFVDRQLTAARAFVDVRVFGIHEIGPIFPNYTSTSGHD